MVSALLLLSATLASASTPGVDAILDIQAQAGGPVLVGVAGAHGKTTATQLARALTSSDAQVVLLPEGGDPRSLLADRLASAGFACGVLVLAETDTRTSYQPVGACGGTASVSIPEVPVTSLPPVSPPRTREPFHAAIFPVHVVSGSQGVSFSSGATVDLRRSDHRSYAAGLAVQVGRVMVLDADASFRYHPRGFFTGFFSDLGGGMTAATGAGNPGVAFHGRVLAGRRFQPVTDRDAAP